MKTKLKSLRIGTVLETLGTVLTAGLIVGMGLSAVSVAVSFALYGI